MIKTTYSNINYLSQDYLDKFMNDLNNDITGIINSTRIDVNMFLETPKYVKNINSFFNYYQGFKAVVVRYFELIRFLGISYYTNTNYDFLNAPEFDEISNN